MKLFIMSAYFLLNFVARLMINITINGESFSVPENITVIQACELANVEIPRFCYHERLTIAGNCRMCLVEIQGGPPKPEASCTTVVRDGMVISTNSPMVKNARKSVLEFMLINHPLDCPICDQGGECDLQDQALKYGSGCSRFDKDKRAVQEKYMSPVIKTNMTRCIHCTRCIRFTDMIGDYSMAAVGRGEHMEISTLEHTVKSELSGNVVDLCPVGALTSAPYAFKARPWELRHADCVDVMDAVGSSIRVDYVGSEVMRVLPRQDDRLNEEWLSDKSRFAYDGLRSQRLDRPYVRVDGVLRPASWDEAYKTIASRMQELQGSQMAAIAGGMVDCESMFLLRKIMQGRGCDNLECRPEGVHMPTDNRSAYIMNTGVAALEDADFILMVATDFRYEASMANWRIRKAYMKGAKIYNLGTACNFNYVVTELGDDVQTIQDMYDNKHMLCEGMRNAKNPVIIVGQGALVRDDSDVLLSMLMSVAERCGVVREDWNGFNVVPQNISTVGGMELQFTSSREGGAKSIMQDIQSGNIKLLYLLDEDEDAVPAAKDDVFVIYQGHHGDKGANRADVILPGAAYTEKDALYLNMECRLLESFAATAPPGNAKDDKVILQELAKVLGQKLSMESIEDIRSAMAISNGVFKKIGAVPDVEWRVATCRAGSSLDRGVNLESRCKDFYLSNSVCRASSTMAKCLEDRTPS